ncbi:N-6 DNA methylase [Myxococcota bacterium]|nr:N-6 DNA methylase [Myxococcota bacterium]
MTPNFSDKVGFIWSVAGLLRGNYKPSEYGRVILPFLVLLGNHEMGFIFEDLIRKFSEQSNETAGEHFTPREVICFMVNLLFAENETMLHKPGIIRTTCNPACRTGEMLSVAEEHLARLNPQARLKVFGQGLTDDGPPDLQADYLISNPPFCVDWRAHGPSSRRPDPKNDGSMKNEEALQMKKLLGCAARHLNQVGGLKEPQRRSPSKRSSTTDEVIPAALPCRAYD